MKDLTAWERVEIWVADTARATFAPQPLVRLEIIRILVPLAILGFLSSRLIHADDWLSSVGFRLPDIPDDWRQPIRVPGLPTWGAWTVCITLVASGLATSAGLFTRITSAVFALCLVYVALADRLAAFTVSKIGPILILAICLSPAGARWSVDAWLRKNRDATWVPPTLVSGGSVRFFQVMLPVFYLSSGYSKATGDWLSYPYVLWTHLHDSYQTPISWFIANHTPPWGFTILQGITLAFECLAPIWFLLPWTRPFAFAWAVAMHLMIGLMFGPVIWFALLMISLLVGSYAPERWLNWIFRIT